VAVVLVAVVGVEEEELLDLFKIINKIQAKQSTNIKTVHNPIILSFRKVLAKKSIISLTRFI
jgi:hypothetical protein